MIGITIGGSYFIITGVGAFPKGYYIAEQQGNTVGIRGKGFGSWIVGPATIDKWTGYTDINTLLTALQAI